MWIELFYKKTTFATVASTIAAVSNIILNYIFIKLFGFVAAGYTTMVCYALLALLHYINVKNKKYDDAIDNKKILAISIVVIVVSILISILYSHRLLRYSFILIISLAAFIKRKAIIVMLRKSWMYVNSALSDNKCICRKDLFKVYINDKKWHLESES